VFTKARFFGLLAVLILGFLILRPGEEPSDSGDRGDRPASATGRQPQPREPSFLAPRHDYGIAGATRPSGTPPPYGRRDDYTSGSYSDAYSDAYSDRAGTFDPYAPDYRNAAQGYRFRPLTEREQQRQRAQSSYQGRYADQYRTPYDAPDPYYPSNGAWDDSAAPAPYSEPGSYAGPQQDAYDFRPLDQSPTAQGRWQGPYPEPGQRYDPYSTDPWMSPPPPQWGSTPPAQRMYPSYYRDSGYRLTAR
jgi:hypothetical protein